MSSIIKTVKKYGNSGGVYLPSEWIGGQVKIDLVKEPLDTKKDLLSLPLEHVVCIILYGSYARGEMTQDSDIDVIVVIDDNDNIEIPSWIKGKYDIEVRTVSKIRNSLKNDPVFYRVIRDESIALFNHKFLEELRKIRLENPNNGMKFRLDTSESSLNIVKKFISLGAEPSDLAYPLIMRLKEALFIECFLKNKKYTTSLLKKEMHDSGISSNDFEILLNLYRAIRDEKKSKGNVSMETIAKLAELLEKKIAYVKQKANKKGN